MSKTNIKDFKAFGTYFPEIELPITITADSTIEFSKFNKPLAQSLIETIIIPIEGPAIDEYTEFTPCFQLPPTNDYYAFVYWKGQLLLYEYILVTFDKSGNLISRKVISGTRVENEKVIQSVCNIDEDLIIHIIVGGQVQNAEDVQYDAQSSQAMSMEILTSGDIIFSLQEH